MKTSPKDKSPSLSSLPSTSTTPTSFPTIAFDQPDEIIYFNNSGKTPLPLSAQRAGEIAIQQEAQPWTLPSVDATNEIRTLFSKIVHADSEDDIAIVPSTGFAMTLIAHNLFRNDININDEKKKVLILQDEMSSEVYAWQEPENIELLIVPHPTTDNGWTQSILSTLKLHSSTIAICCIPQVHWSDGSYIDLKLIGHYCRQNSIKLVVDGTQSVGVMRMNVKEIYCDALACSVHKWLLGPHGLSLVYIHPKYHETWLPLDQHERSRVVFQNEVYDATEDNIKENGYPDTFVRGAKRCDAGGKKNPILQPMICEGLKIVNSLDLDEVQRYLRSITDEVLEGAKSFGFGVQPGPRCGHIIGIRPKDPELVKVLTPEKMVEVTHNLAKRNIFVAARCGAFRISPYLKTTSNDVQCLLDALEEECEQVRRENA